MTKNTAAEVSDTQLFMRLTLYGTLILGVLFIASLWLEKLLLPVAGKYADDIRIGVMLLLMWAVITGLVRSGNKLKRSIEGWKLMLLALLVGVGGALIFNLFRTLFPNVIWSQETATVEGFNWGSFLFFGAVGLVFGMITVIKERVHSKFWENILILLVALGIALIIFYFAK